MEINFDKLNELIDNKQIEELKIFIAENNLEIRDGKIFSKNKDDVKEAIKYWDALQHAKKINLNAAYGALLNENGRFYDQRLGQSTTLTGRVIARHMDATVNESLTGKYDYTGDSIIYGDSVTGDTMILTEDGDLSIENLFNQCPEIVEIKDKEYGSGLGYKVIGFSSFEDEPVWANVAYIMRHRTKKKIYQLTFANGNQIKVTEDHSVMIDRNGFLIEVKPTEILPNDLIICLKR
jgi:intein/homing endonuclease